MIGPPGNWQCNLVFLDFVDIITAGLPTVFIISDNSLSVLSSLLLQLCYCNYCLFKTIPANDILILLLPLNALYIYIYILCGKTGHGNTPERSENTQHVVTCVDTLDIERNKTIRKHFTKIFVIKNWYFGTQDKPVDALSLQKMLQDVDTNHSSYLLVTKTSDAPSYWNHA